MSFSDRGFIDILIVHFICDACYFLCLIKWKYQNQMNDNHVNQWYPDFLSQQSILSPYNFLLVTECSYPPIYK